MKIYVTQAEFRSTHVSHKAYGTDTFYVDLANRLCASLMSWRSKSYSLATLKRMSLKAACYMEDIVADMGLWRSLSAQCRRRYGFDVPLYHAAEDYYADEPSLNAVRYLVWDAVRLENSDYMIQAESPELLAMGDTVYAALSDAFEQAPVNDEAKADLQALIADAGTGFNGLRKALLWVCLNDYLVNDQTEALLYHILDDIRQEQPRPMTPQMELYFAHMRMLVDYRIGPLALYPREWLADLARIYGFEQTCRDLADMEVLPFGHFTYHIADDGVMHLESEQGRTLTVEAGALPGDKEQLKKMKDCLAQFVRYQGKWSLNGVIMPMRLKEETAEKGEKAAVTSAQDTQKMDVRQLLERTGGRRLLFFKDSDEMVEAMKKMGLFPQDRPNPFPKDEAHKLPCLFVDEADPKNNVFVSFNTSPGICSPDNPYYDADLAREHAADILWSRELSSSFADYLITHQLLPATAHSPLFCKGATDEQLRGDMHFLLRTEKRAAY